MCLGVFFMMGRRFGLLDFRGMLIYDFILSVQVSFIFFGVFYGILLVSGGGVGWWMFFYLYFYGFTLDYFISYFFGGWFIYERDCVFVSYERFEECFYSLVRFRSSGIMNGVSLFGGFGSGFGIFYLLFLSLQLMYSFVYQVSFIFVGIKNVLVYWGSYGNYDGKSVFDFGDSYDLDMILRFNVVIGYK